MSGSLRRKLRHHPNKVFSRKTPSDSVQAAIALVHLLQLRRLALEINRLQAHSAEKSRPSRLKPATVIDASQRVWEELSASRKQRAKRRRRRRSSFTQNKRSLRTAMLQEG